MKIALHYPYKDKAETEIARRLEMAFAKNGHEAQLCQISNDIYQYAPDFVIAMHMDCAKVTDIPTFGAMWNPPAFWANIPHLVKNIISYDGYLCANEEIERFISDLEYGLGRNSPKGKLLPSACETQYNEIDFSTAKLAYIGTNWDGPRFQDLMMNLAKSANVSFFGPDGLWDHVGQSYEGSIPFDGKSLISTLQGHGISLCLHRQEHIDVAIPNMRVFEAAAASNCMICDDHPFVREVFGENVFYIDNELPPDGLARQILSHLDFIRANPQIAKKMARECHAAYVKNFTLEAISKAIIDEFNAFQSVSKLPKIMPKIDCIVRTGGRDTKYLTRALNSLNNQILKPSRIVIINNFAQNAPLEIIKKFENNFKFEIIDVEKPNGRSHSLWIGLKSLKGDFFCNLDDDDTFLPNHLLELYNALIKSDAPLAYSGAIRIMEGEEENVENRFLSYLEPFNKNKLFNGENYITSNGFLARTSALDENISHDPNLEVLEDYWLLLQLLQGGDFVSTMRPSCEYYLRSSKQENISFDEEKFDTAKQIIRTRLYFSPNNVANGFALQPIIQRNKSQNTKYSRTVELTDSLVQAQAIDGNIDILKVQNGIIEISGWAPFKSYSAAQKLIILTDLAFGKVESHTTLRPDVARTMGDWGYFRCGFDIKFKPDNMDCVNSIQLFAQEESGKIFEIRNNLCNTSEVKTSIVSRLFSKALSFNKKDN